MTNPERLTAFGLDALAYYFIPRWATDYAARKVITSNLNKAIEAKCGSAGASNYGDLDKQLQQSIHHPYFVSPTWPSKMPLVGGWRVLPFKWWPGDPVSLWFLGSMSDNWWYKAPLYAGAAAAISMSRGGIFLSNLRGVKGLDPVQNGKYSTAFKEVTNNIQCNGTEPPSGGTPEPVTDPNEATDPQVTPADAEATPVSNMIGGAQLSGIPLNDLNGQLAKYYGSSSASSPSVSKINPVSGAKPTITIVPLVTPVPLTLPQVKPVPVIVRPMPILAR